ncbi:MAG: M20/M25/M40 family metallo-hydrolase [Kofleriaceae bacterium]|nr:M20/M25/M40 family metallo-hydrolase [Kofleriaceae bacterium]
MASLAALVPLACVAVLGSCVLRPAVSASPSSNAWAAQTDYLVLQPAVVAAAALQHQQQLIVAAAHQSRAAFEKLAQLTDGIGHRLSGSAGLTRALQWAADTMRADGHANVHIEPVMVPHWVRGPASALATSSVRGALPRQLHVLALGGSVAGDVTGRVLVVKSWDELEQRKADVAGAIVLFNVAMPAWTKAHGSGYGDVVGYRVGAARAAAKLGAAAVLMRSVTAHSLGTLHTGSMSYADDVAKIPAATITVEDATWLQRTTASGATITVRLQLQTEQLPDAASGNVIAELRGSVWPDEIVVLAAHIDSWDVGQGAHDDGAGCVIMMQALTTLRQLHLTPKRTIRVVLYTNEENGVRGARQYALDHVKELGHHVAAIESDSGGFAPTGFALEVASGTPLAQQQRVQQRARALVTAAGRVGAGRVTLGYAGTDIEPLIEARVPGFGLTVDNRTYFDIHHSDADTLDKVDPAQLADGVAAVAALAYGLAQASERLLPERLPPLASTGTAP